MTAAIRIARLSKRFGAVEALRDLDLEVASGEIFGFLGPNGAGKTTTIRILLDLLRPTSGSARILDLDPRRDAVELKRHVGYVPGELRLYPRMTGRELLAFATALRKRGDPARIAADADRFHAPLDTPIGTLSHGNRQKIGILLALAHDPDVLILDEPTQGLDPLMQHTFADLLRERRAQGRTAFLSSHDLSEVASVCDRVAMIRTGRLLAVEQVDELRHRAARSMRIRFDAPPPPDAFRNLPNARALRVEGPVLRCIVAGSPDAILKAAARFTILELTSEEPSLEDVFLARYDHGSARDVA